MRKEHLNIVGREFFQVSLVTYLGLTLGETLRPGFVSNFFNLNYVLLVVLVSGVVMVLTEPAEGQVGQIVAKAQEEVRKAIHRLPTRPTPKRTIDGVRRVAKPLQEPSAMAKPIHRPLQHVQKSQKPRQLG